MIGILVCDEAANTYNYISSNGETDYTKGIDDAVAEIESVAKKNNKSVKLYNSFNSGAYLEFIGYKTYIDPRADSFVIEANLDYDYLTEYIKNANGKIYHKKIFDKYGFTYAIFEYDIETPLYTSLKNDDSCEEIFKGKEITVFRIN